VSRWFGQNEKMEILFLFLDNHLAGINTFHFFSKINIKKRNTHQLWCLILVEIDAANKVPYFYYSSVIFFFLTQSHGTKKYGFGNGISKKWRYQVIFI
jgi:hypothetical protein